MTMAEIYLSSGNIALIDDEDLHKVRGYKWYEFNGYAARMTRNNEGKRKVLFLHRIILPCASGAVIDHINRNRLDNRKCNLRVTTRRNNNINRKRIEEATSPYRGVIWRPHAKKWKGYIKVNKKQLHLGYFDTPEEAAMAYNIAAHEHFGNFAVYNLIPD